MKDRLNRLNNGPAWGALRQRGALTLFSAVLILILMTLMLLYASRTGIFESRIAANDVRQKVAFNAAEAAVDQGLMFAIANGRRILSSRLDAFPPLAVDSSGNPILDANGAYTYTGDGWLASGSERWVACTSTDRASATHPCGGDIPAPAGAYYYDTDGDTSTREVLPFQPAGFPAGTTARASALLCFITPGTDPYATGGSCDGPTAPTVEDEAGASVMMLLLGYGYSDCTLPTGVASLDVATNLDTICTGKATVAQPVGNYRNLAGNPTVPLVNRSTFPPSGSADIVPNPNGGGVGVPISAWLNINPSCPSETCSNQGVCTDITTVQGILDSSGNWQTCEAEEWYGLNGRPANVQCENNTMRCGCQTVDQSYQLSYKQSGNTKVNIDIVPDDEFPCDLFEFFFGEPDSNYDAVKAVSQVITDCSGLNVNSSGLYWVTGPVCRLNNSQIGTPDNPVVLISAAQETRITGNAELYGLLYIFDGEYSDASLASAGTMTVYGAAIVDGSLDKYTGTFQIVYTPGILATAAGIGSFGSINGGWRDFGLPDIGW